MPSHSQPYFKTGRTILFVSYVRTLTDSSAEYISYAFFGLRVCIHVARFTCARYDLRLLQNSIPVNPFLAALVPYFVNRISHEEAFNKLRSRTSQRTVGVELTIFIREDDKTWQ